MTDQELIDFLNQNPNVKDKLKDLAKVSNNVNFEFTRGDDAEEAVINYSRELNKELLQTWGATESARVSGNVEAQIPTAKKHRLKKIKWHTRCGDIELFEQAYYSKRKGTIRAFQLSSGIRNHAYASGLQRVMVDFGIDESFNKAELKLKEHYGITIAATAIRSITLNHAHKVKAHQNQQMARPISNLNSASQLISETDGSMVPIVIGNPKAQDKRKTKQVVYREARLSLAYEPGSTTLKFSGAICDTARAGLHMKYSAKLAGLGPATLIHAIGDGAPWIAEEVDAQFGCNARYLLDFYHASEYLSKSSHECAEIEPSKWFHAQQQLLKCGKHQTVINNLRNYALEHENSSTYQCYHYLNKRTHQLHYDKAIRSSLPIGSGEIESAHRYIVQARLKITGAWWSEQNANSMIALRICRANQMWQEYWNTVR